MSFYLVDLKNICIALVMEIFYEEESMKKIKFIRLFCMYYWYSAGRPFRYAERFSGTSVFYLLFLVMQKSKSQSRLERQSQTIDHTLSIKEIRIF